jgi:hypothetical protein
VVRVALVPTWVSVTVAPTITPPETSVAVPTIDPVAVCPMRDVGRSRAANRTNVQIVAGLTLINKVSIDSHLKLLNV